MAATQSETFALSAKVTKISRKDTTYICNISIETSEGKWTLNRSFNDFESLHANLIANDKFRGLNFPKLPDRNNAELPSKKREFTAYLSEILRRSILLGSKSILDFIQAPETVKSAARKVMEAESMPIKRGMMKKEGEKWRSFKSRYDYHT